MKPATLEEAMRLHRAGELDAAAGAYEAVLGVQPNERDALHLLAVVRAAQGDPAAAEALVRKAIAIEGKAPAYHSTLGAILGDLGQHVEAVRACERAVAMSGGDPELLHNLAHALERGGRTDAALETYKKALLSQPRLVRSHVAVASLHRKAGRLAESLGECMIAIALDPKCADAHYQIAAICLEKGELAAAVDEYRRAIGADPRHVAAHVGLARALVVLQRAAEARPFAEQALALDDRSAPAHHALGEVLRAEGRVEDALQAFKRAQALEPGEPQHVVAQALALASKGALPLAVSTAEGLLAAFPERAELCALLADLSYRVGNLTKARAAVDRALELDPQRLGWQSFRLGIAHADPGDTREHLFKLATDWGAGAVRRAKRLPPAAPDRSARRVLNVGYVSGDLRMHPIGYFLGASLPYHDRQRVRVHAYANHELDDEQTRVLQRSIDSWRNVRYLSDDALAAQIREDEIDILIDLSGHTNGHRLEAFARKPSPIQATWLGSFSTTGLDAIDWVIADAIVLPPEEQKWFVERAWLLDGCYLCAPRLRMPLPIGPLPMVARGSPTFGCFNNLIKISEPTVRTWARVLLAVPGSRLVLKTHVLSDEQGRRETAERFARHGIAPERLTLLGYSARLDLLRVYREIDVALDPFPYGGGTTTFEALWMGVPVVSRRGDRFLSRVSESMLTAIGVPELVAGDEDAYVEKARSLVADPVTLSAMRASLRDRILASPLTDGRAFARRFDDALRGMWLKYLEETDA